MLLLVLVVVARGGLKGNGEFEDEDEDEEGVLERYRRRCCRGCHGRRFSAALTTRHHLLRHSNILLGTELLLLAGASRSCEQQGKVDFSGKKTFPKVRHIPKISPVIVSSSHWLPNPKNYPGDAGGLA